MKKSKLAVTVALTAALAVTPALGGCSGDHYDKISFAAQDTSYAVTSQGGSAVAYGNYLYFVNGYRGYDDTDGKANVWGDVVKGALYRAEFNGDKVDGTPAQFNIKADSSALEFKYTEGTDYDDNPIDVVDVTAIAPKTVGTTGYARGGLFIYDNYIYFATPNNLKNSTGTVQTTRTDFFMMPLSGGEPTKLYTTSEGVDTSSSAYAVYKYNGSIYIVVNEGEKIVSIKVDTKKAKAEDPVEYDVGATSVYFPVRDTYYNGIDDDTVEDFVYFVRNVDDDDTQKAGTVIEAMRPDGSENFVISMTGKTETIEAVRDGIFFYRTQDTVGNTVIAYDSLHDALSEYSSGYRESHSEDGRQISGQFPTNVASLTATYAFRPDVKSNVVYFIGVTDSNIKLHETDGNETTIASTSGTPQFINGNYLYISGSNKDFYRIPLYKNISGYGSAQKLAEETATATLSCDYAAGYFSYYAKVDEWADSYTYFYKVDGIEGAEPQFVGQRSSDDIPTDEELEEYKKGEEEETEGETAGE